MNDSMAILVTRGTDISMALLVARILDYRGAHLVCVDRKKPFEEPMYINRLPPIPLPSIYGDRPVQKIKTRDKYAPKEALEAIDRANRRMAAGKDIKEAKP